MTVENFSRFRLTTEKHLDGKSKLAHTQPGSLVFSSTMIKTVFLIILFGWVILSGSSRSAQGGGVDLSQFRWKKRLLFLFSPDNSHPFFVQLHESLGIQKSETLERDLIIFEIFEYGTSRMNSEFIDPMITRALREKFRVVSGEFTVILLGKDGGIKLKRHDRTELKDIFGLIDSMPMRQEEMHKKNR